MIRHTSDPLFRWMFQIREYSHVGVHNARHGPDNFSKRGPAGE